MRARKERRPEPIQGNAVRPLRDGDETFPAMLEAIAGAKAFVHQEVYILRDDAIGRRFADAFIERARAGIAVRVIVDSVGSLTTPDAFFQRMIDAGVRVVVFHPLAPWKRKWGWFVRRDHRKILVVDGEVGFTGGLNYDLCHSSKAQGGADWRDTHVEIRGPAVAELDRLFREVWLEHSRERPPPGFLPVTPGPPRGRQVVRVVANRPWRHGSAIRREYIAALVSAKERAWITNPYFLPDAGLIRAMTRAARRGVDVRVLVPLVSDVRPIDIAMRPLISLLVHRGVRVFTYRGRVLHAKTAVIDSFWSTAGSFNLDPLSFKNLELNVVVEDRDFAREIEAAFLEDLKSCAEAVPARVDPSPAYLRFASRTLYGLRHWL